MRTSFWFVPGSMAIGAGALVFGAQTVDSLLAAGAGALPWYVYVSTPDEAREVVSTLLSSMITMASLVFSITMVVLSLAASQFGPRLIRNFMASPQTQLVLGTFVMTIVYSLVVLAFIASRGKNDTQAYTSVSIAILLTLVSVGLLVAFLHVLARSIVSETVIERVGCELDASLDEFIHTGPEPAGHVQWQVPPDFEARSARFGPRRAGYVQVIDFETLVGLAEEANLTVVLKFRPGDYVAKDGQGVAAYPAEHAHDDIKREIMRCIVVGTHRTPVQDPEFSIRHLVEIAVRALSPGVNDPYTATAVIARLSASLSRLMYCTLPSGSYLDRSGSVRVVSQMATHQTLVSTAFDQIRQNGSDKPLVVLHLLEAIGRVGEHAQLPDQRRFLLEQAQIMIDEARRSIANPVDLGAIERRFEAASQPLLGRD